ncbi:MAG: hypothetical protein L0L28_11365, partial [Corynebacterium flavescens]|uniref:hypothetical protein n=1 Tax=Corynebacterium flavescens TaxID=28028 RepID=UPI002655468E|nr:hypothetical protein [Corynebacterium flavescens]
MQGVHHDLPFTPLPGLLPAWLHPAAALIALGATCGRLIIGSGTSWTMLAILASAVLFGITAADSIHLREYQL